MENSRKYKFLVRAVWMLITLNCMLMAFILLGPKPHPPGPPPVGSTREMLVRELKLNDGQIKQYDRLIDKHRQQMQDINEEKGKILDAIYQSIDEDNEAQINYLGELEKQKEKITRSHFREVRVLLNKQQQITFDKIIARAIQRLKPPPPPPGPPGPPPPPGE